MSPIGDDLIQLAEHDPVACVDVCQTIITDGPAAQEALAYRAMGIARRSLGQVEASIADLETSRDLFQANENLAESAESTISLSASVAMSGDINASLAILAPLLDDPLVSVQAHAQVQNAGIIARSGDLSGAMGLYALAQPQLEQLDDRRWLALMHSTRGLVQTFLGEFDGAERDLETARALFVEMERESSAAEMVHNLGFVAVQRGDLARGLSILIEAEGLFMQAGQPTEAILVDRSHAYMLAGLPGLAHETAEKAAEELGHQSRELERTEALYQAAAAALANRDPLTAERTAAQAVSLAEGQGRTMWQLLSRIILEEASWRAGHAAEPDQLVELAEAFSTQKNLPGAEHAWALAALVSLDRGDVEASAGFVAEARAMDSATFELPVRLLTHLAEARLEIDRDNRAGAQRALEAAADMVDSSRILLSATEARAGVSGLAEEIADLGIANLHATGASVIDWSERFRGASLRIAPVVMSPDTELAKSLSDLRSGRREIADLTREGEDVTSLAENAARLESRIRDMSMARDRGVGVAPAIHPIDEIAGALDARQLFYIYDANGRSYGELISRAGHKLIDLGDSQHIGSLHAHMEAALRRAFRYPAPEASIRVRRLLEELGPMLLGMVAVDGHEKVIVPPPSLIALPWNALAKSVDPSLEVVVAPSASTWLDAIRREGIRDGIAVVAGPGLAHAETEAIAVANLHSGGAEMLAGEGATVEAVASAMRRNGHMHVVAHTRLRHDNPMFSALELADGPLSLYDLEEAGSVPDRVVMSACESGHENVVGGHEMFGLTSVLLARGSQSILATVAPIPDGDSSIVAVRRIHRELAAGTSAGSAMNRALRMPDGRTVDPSVAFVAYGS